jgi:2,3-bisphosphoglycerate-independent phosphoglycerate mutase
VGRVCLVFLDGVGLGVDDPMANALAASWPGLESLAGGRWTLPTWPTAALEGRVARALDATLGVPGLPQSATGQASLLTGRNAAEVMGGHYGPWPGPTLQRLLDQETLFHAGASAGGAVLANVYPPGYFAAIAARRARRSAPVYAALAAGLVLADLHAYEAGAGVSADLDGSYLRGGRREWGDVDGPAVEEQAARLAVLAAGHAFTFFDVWLTDHLGHRGDAAAVKALLARLDVFLAALVGLLPSDVTLVVTSDHGNLEDGTTRRHTLAPVPLVVRGPWARAFEGARAITDVAAGVRAVLARAEAASAGG